LPFQRDLKRAGHRRTGARCGRRAIRPAATHRTIST
jgi:hypothetical protein